jgi:hypothetical protein
MFFKYTKSSKIQNLDNHGNKKLVVLIYCLLVAKLSIKILNMALLSFCHYSSDPSGTFIIKAINNESNKCLCVNQVSFLDVCFCCILFCIAISKSPLPKSHSF